MLSKPSPPSGFSSRCLLSTVPHSSVGGSGAASILPPMRRFGRATGPTVSKAEVVDKVNVLIQRFGDIVDPAALVEGQSA